MDLLKVVQKRWMASLHLDEELQNINKEATRELFSSNTGSYRRFHNRGSGFVERVYERSAADKVSWVIMNGEEWKEGPYSDDDLYKYLKGESGVREVKKIERCVDI